jgi:hypothetical protein
MKKEAEDPELQDELRKISQEFAPTESNGLVTFKSVYMGLHKRDLLQRAARRTGMGLF